MPRPGRPTTERAKDFKGTLRQLIRTMSHYKLPLAAAMLFAILSTIFNIAGPKVLAKATTALATGWIARLRGTGSIDFVYIGRILLFLLGMYLLSSAFSFIQGWLMTGLSQKVDQLGAALREFDAVVVRSKTKVRANHIDEAKGGKLKLIIRGGVGVDNIDVKYAEANGITVKNTPRASSQSVAELAMGHMFSCARYLSIAGHTMREGKWEKKAYGKGIELQGKTLGIVGFGRIGQHLGVMAKAIGMDVIAFDIFHIPGIEEQLGIPYVEMDELLAKSDFISVHAPAVDGGALINAERIAKMKDGVCIINTSRGTNVDEAALLDALNSGKVRAAGLDVYADEPASNAALYSHPMVSCTPHIGAATVEAQKRIGAEIVDIITNFKA